MILSLLYWCLAVIAIIIAVLRLIGFITTPLNVEGLLMANSILLLVLVGKQIQSRKIGVETK